MESEFKPCEKLQTINTLNFSTRNLAGTPHRARPRVLSTRARRHITPKRCRRHSVLQAIHARRRDGERRLLRALRNRPGLGVRRCRKSAANRKSFASQFPGLGLRTRKTRPPPALSNLARQPRRRY